MTIEEAKKKYFIYDGSLFAMAREDKNAYENYKLLKITSDIEVEWSKELFYILLEKLKKYGNSIFFNRMSHITEKFHNKSSLVSMINALTLIKFTSLEERLCVYETVIGRKEIKIRSGMIYWAYDTGEKELAVELLELITKELKNVPNEQNINVRINRDIEKCIMINNDLFLNKSMK